MSDAITGRVVLIVGGTRGLGLSAARRLVVNPGAAGARRFHLQPCVARLYLWQGQADVELVPLLPAEAPEG
jgi:NAD(P)-dependent dehydrogenase (short-subunit alcohol dehydrogenase family)